MEFARLKVAVAVLAVLVPLTPTVVAAGTVGADASFEQTSNGRPVCWQSGGTGTSKAIPTPVTGGRTGVHAGRVHVSGLVSGNRTLVTSRRDRSCAVAARSGRTYDLGEHYRAAASSGAMTSDDAWAFEAADAGSTDPALFSSDFDLPDGLITNEYARRTPRRTDGRVSPDWQMTSGSLFSRSGAAYSGEVDDVGPDATSSNGTNSAVFRLHTRRFDFQDVSVAMRLRVDELTSTAYTPPVAWDGMHLVLRYKSQYHLYYASVARRDGRLVIKKKCPGGGANGGTYYSLTSAVAGHDIPLGAWRNVIVSVRDEADGTVSLSMLVDGRTVTTVDDGVGCAPLTGTGAVGIRGDNSEFQFDDLVVTRLP